MTMPPSQTERILLTGATGYVGGRLLHALEQGERPVRCLARRPDHLRPHAAPTTEVVRGDLMDRESLVAGLQGVSTAYYLVHSLGSGAGFEEQERRAADNFASAAREVGVRRIIYLGGLASDAELSPHLRSRHAVGRILRASGVPTIEFRASIILGSGSLSFEIIRGLVEKLPVMITPRWTRSLAQPIAIEDVVAYLTAGLDMRLEESRVFEIGGAEVVSYADIMQEYARQRQLRRFIVPVPVLTPKLSSLWLALITPVYARVGRRLIESVRHDTVVNDGSALKALDIRPRSTAEAIARALVNEDTQFARTRWSDALSSGGPPPSWGGVRFGPRIVDSRTADVPVAPTLAFAPIARIGGRTGWYYADILWRVRGLIDQMIGGVGMRRGRRHPERLAVGDAVDFWRVEAFEPDRLLRLSAEMRVPGRAWLQFEVDGDDRGSTIRQTAIFDPVGIFGLAYWYVLYPIHGLIFAGMLRTIAQWAVRKPMFAR